jgi:hypothetical protein
MGELDNGIFMQETHSLRSEVLLQWEYFTVQFCFHFEKIKVEYPSCLPNYAVSNPVVSYFNVVILFDKRHAKCLHKIFENIFFYSLGYRTKPGKSLKFNVYYVRPKIS